MTEFTPHPIPDGTVDVDGQTYMRDAKGGLIPIGAVKPQDLLKDEMVRKIAGHWIALSQQLERHKAHVVDDIDMVVDLLSSEYGIKVGGRKGNMSFISIDGLFKIELRIGDVIDFGPELQIAKALVDECLIEWSRDARDELRAIISNAFHTDQAGKVNRAEIVKLTRLKVEDDERWSRAMDAIRDAQRVVSSKAYIYCHKRDRFDGKWQAVTIDMAKA